MESSLVVLYTMAVSTHAELDRARADMGQCACNSLLRLVKSMRKPTPVCAGHRYQGIDCRTNMGQCACNSLFRMVKYVKSK